MDEEEEGYFDHVYQKLTMKEISSNVLESVKSLFALIPVMCVYLLFSSFTPSIAALNELTKDKKKYEIFKKMLERTRKGGKHLDYLQQPDASEQLPVGRVSQHIFEGIARSRAFDRYGRQVKWEEEEEEELSMAFLNKGREEDASTIATTQSLQFVALLFFSFFAVLHAGKTVLLSLPVLPVMPTHSWPPSLSRRKRTT